MEARVGAQSILIIGGSMSGLLTANLLGRRGFDVHVFERSDTELSARGAGIIAQPQIFDALALIGADPSIMRNFGVAIERRRTLARDGSVELETYLPQIATSWNRLFQILREALPSERYHLRHEVTDIESIADGVRVRFTNGATRQGSLLVGADGFRSRVRASVSAAEPLYAGYVAWRGMVEEAALSPSTRRDIFDYFAFGLPPGQQILGYPVAGAGDDIRVGHRRYNFVWYRPADEGTELPALLTDTDGKRHAMSIPPPSIQPRHVEEMRAVADAVFARQFAEIVQRTAQPFLQPIYDLTTARMVNGRIALVGDAAFVARPHVGAGTAKAADDALALTDALSREASMEAALHAFEFARAPIGRRIVEQARRLGAYMKRDSASGAERDGAALDHAPRAVMAATALIGA